MYTLEPFALADRPVSCGDWLEFIDDGGYARLPELWLSDGVGRTVSSEQLGLLHSIGTKRMESGAAIYTLGGLQRCRHHCRTR